MASEARYAMEAFGPGAMADAQLIAGVIEGGVNEISCARIEIVSDNKLLKLEDFVGQNAGFKIEGAGGKEQIYYGTCISAEFKGAPDAKGHYFLEIKPWGYFLTRATNNRIFQEKTTLEIVDEILGEYGFAGDLVKEQTGTPTTRPYCVQYRETDLDFIRRLLEEDGFYFYFRYTASDVKMVIADTASTHADADGEKVVPFRDDEDGTQLEHISRWEAAEKVVSGKLTLDDYNFERPRADLTVKSTDPKGSNPHISYEIYKYPGRYQETADGDRYVAAMMDAEAAGHKRWTGEGNVFHIRPGQIFELADHPRHSTSAAKNFLMTKVRQVFRLESEENREFQSILEKVEDFGLAVLEHSRMTFEAVLKADTFRMPMLTPRPVMSGVQTAVVTGPSGEEIHCDQYGRIKVQFHWDRDGQNDDKTTCFVRVMTPMAGKGWGMLSVPRIGQEVVIQFEEGDPDRPICVGMVYNADNMPPYTLPAHATRTGLKSDSSKGSGGFNELAFEDKKGSEMVLLNAEKDYYHKVQNSSHTVVGYDREDGTVTSGADGDGSMKLEVKNNLDEIVESGNHSFTVSTGTQTIEIEGNKTETIKTGNNTQTIKTGNHSQTVDQGNHATKVKMGDLSVNVDMGQITMVAMKKITLKCGASKIVMSPQEIKITSPTIKNDAKMAFEAKGGLNAKIEGGLKTEVKGGLATEVKAGAMLTLKGGITMIN